MVNSGGDPAANTDNIAKEPEKAAHVGRIGNAPGENVPTPSSGNAGKGVPGAKDPKKA